MRTRGRVRLYNTRLKTSNKILCRARHARNPTPHRRQVNARKREFF
jgi:hypothetical protein